MKYLTSKYTSYRGKLLSQKKCQKFFQFVTLPELKIFKTIGFILTIIFQRMIPRAGNAWSERSAVKSCCPYRRVARRIGLCGLTGLRIKNIDHSVDSHPVFSSSDILRVLSKTRNWLCWYLPANLFTQRRINKPPKGALNWLFAIIIALFWILAFYNLGKKTEV